MHSYRGIGRLLSRSLNYEASRHLSDSQRTILKEGALVDTFRIAKRLKLPISLHPGSGSTFLSQVNEFTGGRAGAIRTSAMNASEEIIRGSPLLGSFELFNECYLFSSTVTSRSREEVVLAAPLEMVRIHQRELDRCALEPNQHIPVSLRETVGKRQIDAAIVDLTPKGLALEVRPSDRCPESRILGLDEDLILEARIQGLDRREPIPVTVVRIDRHPEGAVRLGVACRVPLAMGDEAALEDLLLDRKYPNVRRAASKDDYSDVWRILNLSFETIHAAPDDTRRETSVLTWQKAAWSSRPLNRLYLLNAPVDGHGSAENVGTIATSRYYHKTWLIHQLGVDGTKGQLLSHQLYGRLIDYLRHTNEVKYVFGTFPKQSHVFQRYYIDFIRNDPEQQFHYLESTSILEFKVSDAIADLKQKSGDTEVAVCDFGTEHQDYVIRVLRSRFPAMVLDAFDLRPYDLTLSDVSTLYGHVALRRERKIVVATRDGAPCGFAIVEWGSEDQNVFSLFDNFRIFVGETGNSWQVVVKGALLKKVFQLLEAAQVRSVISWTNETELLSLIPSGKIFYEVYLWVAHHSRMRLFLRHLDRLHGRISTLRAVRGERSAAT